MIQLLQLAKINGSSCQKLKNFNINSLFKQNIMKIMNKKSK
jgi:hypothetical protein